MVKSYVSFAGLTSSAKNSSVQLYRIKNKLIGMLVPRSFVWLESNKAICPLPGIKILDGQCSFTAQSNDHTEVAYYFLLYHILCSKQNKWLLLL